MDQPKEQTTVQGVFAAAIQAECQRIMRHAQALLDFFLVTGECEFTQMLRTTIASVGTFEQIAARVVAAALPAAKAPAAVADEEAQGLFSYRIISTEIATPSEVYGHGWLSEVESSPEAAVLKYLTWDSNGPKRCKWPGSVYCARYPDGEVQEWRYGPCVTLHDAAPRNRP